MQDWQLKGNGYLDRARRICGISEKNFSGVLKEWSQSDNARQHLQQKGVNRKITKALRHLSKAYFVTLCKDPQVLSEWLMRENSNQSPWVWIAYLSKPKHQALVNLFDKKDGELRIKDQKLSDQQIQNAQILLSMPALRDLAQKAGLGDVLKEKDVLPWLLQKPHADTKDLGSVTLNELARFDAWVHAKKDPRNFQNDRKAFAELTHNAKHDVWKSVIEHEGEKTLSQWQAEHEDKETKQAKTMLGFFHWKTDKAAAGVAYEQQNLIKKVSEAYRSAYGLNPLKAIAPFAIGFNVTLKILEPFACVFIDC